MKLLLLVSSIVGSISTPIFNAINIPNTITSPSPYMKNLTLNRDNAKSITYVNGGGGTIRYYKIEIAYEKEILKVDEQIQASNVTYFTLPLEFFNYEPNANMGSATFTIYGEGTPLITYNLTNELSIIAPDTLFTTHSVQSIPYLETYSPNDIIGFTFIIPTYDETARAGYNDWEVIKNNQYGFWYFNHNAFIKRFEVYVTPTEDPGLFDGLFTTFEKGFNSIRSILDIQLFPKITLGTLLFMPLLFAIAYTLIKFLTGGG